MDEERVEGEVLGGLTSNSMEPLFMFICEPETRYILVIADQLVETVRAELDKSDITNVAVVPECALPEYVRGWWQFQSTPQSLLDMARSGGQRAG